MTPEQREDMLQAEGAALDTYWCWVEANPRAWEAIERLKDFTQNHSQLERVAPDLLTATLLDAMAEGDTDMLAAADALRRKALGTIGWYWSASRVDVPDSLESLE